MVALSTRRIFPFRRLRSCAASFVLAPQLWFDWERHLGCTDPDGMARFIECPNLIFQTTGYDGAAILPWWDAFGIEYELLDDHTLDVIAAADQLFVVMTADLSCLKNVRLLIETMSQIGVPAERLALVLNRNKAFTGISIRSAESVLKRQIDHHVVNDYRTAISSLNSGATFMLNRPDVTRRCAECRGPRTAKTGSSRPSKIRETSASKSPKAKWTGWIR